MNQINFKFHGHACVEIEYDGFRIMTDPWFGTPIFFESLVAYPPVTRPTALELDRINMIHISHIHRDHFDPDSLKFFKKNTPVLISDYENINLRQQLSNLGFKTIIEVTESGVEFGPAQFHSFQHQPFNGSFDSLIVITISGRKILLNNDCILSEERYKKMAEKLGPVEYGFLGYCSVSPFPTCYTVGGISNQDLAKAEKENAFLHVKSLDLLFSFRQIIPYANGLRLGRGKNRDHVNSHFQTVEDFIKIPQLNNKIYYCEPGQSWTENFEPQNHLFLDLVPTRYSTELQGQQVATVKSNNALPAVTYLEFLKSYFLSLEKRIDPDWKIAIILGSETELNKLAFLVHQERVQLVLKYEDCDIELQFDISSFNDIVLKKRSIASIFYSFQFQAKYKFLPKARNEKVHTWYL